MSRDFILPDLGEGLTEAAIVAWRVSPGDTVTVDQIIVEVESAKSVVELPTPFAGVIEVLHAEVGQSISAGQPLVTVSDAAGQPAGEAQAAPAGKAQAEPAGKAQAEPAGKAQAEPAVHPAPTRIPGTASDGESGAVLIGYGTREAAPARQRSGGPRFARSTPAAAVAAPASPPVAAASTSSAASASTSGQHSTVTSPVISPIVRRLAKNHGFDASSLHGSGRDALVLRSDVEAHIAQLKGAPSAQATVAQAASFADTDTRIPITGLRKAVADRLSTSRREIPEATVWMDVDATALLAAKAQLQKATRERFSVTALIARFVVAGLRKYPALNSSVDVERGEIVQHSTINLGLAAQTPRGLMVPVVHGAESMTTRQLRDAITALVDSSTSGSFPPAMLSGGTFTLNNFGALGVDGSAAIINHPEAAILGIGRMLERPWVVNHELAVRTVVELSFVFDHRVCDGGTAAGFLTYVASCIENPIGILGDL